MQPSTKGLRRGCFLAAFVCMCEPLRAAHPFRPHYDAHGGAVYACCDFWRACDKYTINKIQFIIYTRAAHVSSCGGGFFLLNTFLFAGVAEGRCDTHPKATAVLTSRAPPVVCALFNPAPPPSACAYQGLIDVSHLAHVSDYTPYKSVPHISLLP